MHTLGIRLYRNLGQHTSCWITLRLSYLKGNWSSMIICQTLWHSTSCKAYSESHLSSAPLIVKNGVLLNIYMHGHLEQQAFCCILYEVCYNIVELETSWEKETCRVRKLHIIFYLI